MLEHCDVSLTVLYRVVLTVRVQVPVKKVRVRVLAARVRLRVLALFIF